MKTTDIAGPKARARSMAPAVAIGEKLYIAECAVGPHTRRHHFAGEVVGMTGDILRLAGYDFVYEATSGNFERKSWQSERILRIDNTMVFYVLPADCALDALTHERNDTELVITDGGSFRLVDRKFAGR